MTEPMTKPVGGNPEIGPEIFDYANLKENSIVVIKPPDHNAFITMRVMEANSLGVVFHSYILHWSVINAINLQGQLVDSLNRQVHVYQYLGQP